MLKKMSRMLQPVAWIAVGISFCAINLRSYDNGPIFYTLGFLVLAGLLTWQSYRES